MNYTREKLNQFLADFDVKKICPSEADRQRILKNPNLKTRLASLVEFGDELIDEPILTIPFSLFRRFEADGDRNEYESSKYGYFAHRKHLVTFALLSWLYKEQRYISKLEDAIWAICDEYCWALPAHLGGTSMQKLQSDGYIIDLFASETGAALAEIIHMLADVLSPIVVKRAEKLINERIIDVANCDFHWKRMINNWSAVCGCNVGVTALYAVKDTQKLAEIIKMSLDCMDVFLSGITEDGACLEGAGYWYYGFGHFAYFCDYIEKATDGKINYFDNPKVKKLATFNVKCIFPGNRAVSFSDSGTRVTRSLDIASFVYSKYPDTLPLDSTVTSGCVSKSGCFNYLSESRALLWPTDRELKTIDFDYGTHIYENAEWYISTSQNKVSIGAKAGHNAESHNHNDVGSFLVYKNGQDILLDIGSGEYCKAYFSKDRYNFFCTSSGGHNVPIINGAYQLCGKDARAINTVISENGISSDIAGAYKQPTLKKLLRTIDFNRTNGEIYLCDSYEFSEIPTAVVERFVTSVEPLVYSDCVQINNNGEQMSIFYDGNVVPKISTETESLGSDRNRLSYVIDFEVKDLKQNFEIKFIIK